MYLYLFGAMEIENPNCLSMNIKFHKISSYTKYQVQMDRAGISSQNGYLKSIHFVNIRYGWLLSRHKSKQKPISTYSEAISSIKTTVEMAKDIHICDC